MESRFGRADWESWFGEPVWESRLGELVWRAGFGELAGETGRGECLRDNLRCKMGDRERISASRFFISYFLSHIY